VGSITAAPVAKDGNPEDQGPLRQSCATSRPSLFGMKRRIGIRRAEVDASGSNWRCFVISEQPTLNHTIAP